ncbi:MAG: hypothetical protein ACR2KH_03080 [Sphingomicrobium sp.]
MIAVIVVAALEAQQAGKAEETEQAELARIVVVAIVAVTSRIGARRFLAAFRRRSAQGVRFLLELLRLLGNLIGLVGDVVLGGGDGRHGDQYGSHQRLCLE